MEFLTWQDVPGWFDFIDIYNQAVDEAPDQGAHFVEVGALLGKSTVAMAGLIRDSGKHIRFDSIDFHRLPSAPSSSWRDGCPSIECVHSAMTTEAAQKFGSVRAGFEHYAEATGTRLNINVVAERDLTVVDQYPDHSLDFFFLDADHKYETTKASLLAWLPKMKPGGIFAGHDYLCEPHPGVKQAVDEVLAGKFTVRGISFWHRIPRESLAE
jgi:hypothetical protein